MHTPIIGGAKVQTLKRIQAPGKSGQTTAHVTVLPRPAPAVALHPAVQAHHPVHPAVPVPHQVAQALRPALPVVAQAVTAMLLVHLMLMAML